MQEMDEDVFDQMVQALQQVELKTPIPEKPNRYRPDGTGDNSPLDPDYFKKYCQQNLKKLFRCPDCGRTLTSKSNYAKHQKTKICMKN